MNAPESTLFNAVPVVSELNRVAGFDPLKFLKKTARGHELELRYKKLWFRLKYPAGRTRLTPLRVTDQLAIIEAKVFFDKDDADPASSYIATMTQGNAPAGLYIQAAEHDALDMALTNAGFGVQFAPMPKADTPYAEQTTPVMETDPAPAPQAAAEQVRTEPAAVQADIESAVVQQPEQEVVHHEEEAVDEQQTRDAAEEVGEDGAEDREGPHVADAPQHEEHAQHERDDARGEGHLEGAHQAAAEVDPRGPPAEELPVPGGELPRHPEAVHHEGEKRDHGGKRDHGAHDHLAAGLGAGRLVEGVAHGHSGLRLGH